MPIYHDRDKFGYQSKFAVVEAFNAAVKDMVRTAFAESGEDWDSFVFGAADRLITRERFAMVPASLTTGGYRFDWSAAVSARENPEIYKPASGMSEADLASFMFDHPDAPRAEPASGRQLCGIGDNVVRYDANVTGIATYIRSPDQVLGYLENGVPPDTIALIDDSGGTLTAPIIQQFKGVICAGGSTRSHLGILTREYAVPCLMNAKVSGLRHGDRVEIEVTATAKSAAAYQKGEEMTANIWRIENGA